MPQGEPNYQTGIQEVKGKNTIFARLMTYNKRVEWTVWVGGNEGQPLCLNASCYFYKPVRTRKVLTESTAVSNSVISNSVWMVTEVTQRLR